MHVQFVILQAQFNVGTTRRRHATLTASDINIVHEAPTAL
jgi:hypothetical protein